MRKITEVVAALIWREGRFLICQRPAHKARGLLWEFVGGKVEPGEGREEALIRECREELDITLSVGDIFMEVDHVYPDITVHLVLFHAAIASGIPKMLEHNDIRWIYPSQIPQYDFCPADEEILTRLMEECGMRFYTVAEDKKQYLELLLLADEQEDMIDRYLERGTLHVLEDGGVKAVCVVTDEGEGMLEVKNLAVHPDHQGKGYGRAMLDHIAEVYRGAYRAVRLGTGDSPLTVPFYEKCGFVRTYTVPNFFVDNYDHPIIEAGVQLVDMVYLQKNLRG